MKNKLQFCLDANCPMKCNNRWHGFASTIMILFIPWAAALLLTAKHLSNKEYRANEQ